MNWYKKARLIDKDKSNKNTYVQCMDCKRFSTDTGWKNTDEMIQGGEPQDAKDANKALAEFEKNNYRSNFGISHTRCPECHEKFMQEIEEYRKKKHELV